MVSQDLYTRHDVSLLNSSIHRRVAVPLYSDGVASYCAMAVGREASPKRLMAEDTRAIYDFKCFQLRAGALTNGGAPGYLETRMPVDLRPCSSIDLGQVSFLSPFFAGPQPPGVLPRRFDKSLRVGFPNVEESLRELGKDGEICTKGKKKIPPKLFLILSQ
jgi:hypothetical protein